MNNPDLKSLKNSVALQKKIAKEMVSSYNYYKDANSQEKKTISEHIEKLKEKLKETNKKTEELLSKINMAKPLNDDSEEIKEGTGIPERIRRQIELPTSVKLIEKYTNKELRPDKLERETFKRLDKKSEEEKKKKNKPLFHEVSSYVKLANKYFFKLSQKLVDDKTMETLERDLTKASMKFTAQEYLAVTMLSGVISVFVAGIIILFFLFFSIGPEWPIITPSTQAVGSRLLSVFWLIFVVPLGTLLLMFFYPTIEKNDKGNKMDAEMPFATLHMSAIAGSLIDPTNIFRIIITTGEYPHLSKEFTKLINEINIYGYDLVSALRDASYNSPSKKLSELYGGLSTTINSGGNLPEFFEKRSESLLFEYGLDKEKRTKAAETFMDIYISVVIAAPMILMILLMMMKISGLGIALSTRMITLIMIIVVTGVNIIFLSIGGGKSSGV